MAATLTSAQLARLPGPPEVLPGRPDAIVDLQTDEGVRLVGGEWRYADARVEQIDFVELGSAEDPLGPGTVPNRTYDVVPHAEGVDFDDSSWRVLAPEETMARLGNGRVAFDWYRIRVTLPAETPEGSTVVFEIVVDDYAEVWVNGSLPLVLGATGGPVVGGFNAPNRVVLTRDAQPGDEFVIAVFGINGPISASPRNYIWMRTATLEFHPPAAPPSSEPERIATGFEFTEGPVWMDGAGLLLSSPNTNAIYRWSPDDRQVTVFRPKSGYTGFDIGRYHQPGSNGLAFSPDGLLTICQHGNRRVLRVNPHGDTTVLADRFDGRRLNSPNDLVYASDGTLYFTDPPFGLPDDSERELDFAGVFRLTVDGALEVIDDSLAGPNGVALSPDERFLYVGNWDEDAKVVVRYDLRDGERAVLHDMTGAPGEDAIDGLEVDPRDGTIYACGPGGIWVLTAEGEHLRTIELPEAPHNLTWGDEDRRTLYVTAETSIYRLRPDEEAR
jgi:gluconolactonase